MNADARPEPPRPEASHSHRTPHAVEPPVLVSALAHRTLSVKEGDAFLYCDLEGNVDEAGPQGLGFYDRDTRFLSHLRLRIGGRDPVLLSSSSERAYVSHVDLTNPRLPGSPDIPQQTLSIRRIRAIRGSLYERVRLKNYNPFPVTVEVELTFGADFADIFEIRGMAHDRSPGTAYPPTTDGRRIRFRYLGNDGVERRTDIDLGSKPDRLETDGGRVTASFPVHLPPRQTRTVAVTVSPSAGDPAAAPAPFDAAVHELRASYETWDREATQIVTDNEVFDQLLDRSLRDVRALMVDIDGVRVPSAGIPWYVALFGRDSLIASHQLLMVNPDIARDTLRALAGLQGTVVDDWRDEQPGKIVHEIRRGELAGAGVVPHTRYFGSVDSTPWFLILLAQHFRWTGDLDLVRELMPNAEAALEWMNRYGDVDGDGFVEYLCRSEGGIHNQGWKDSHDSVVHADGSLAEPPIALAEVQAYVHLAKERMADVFDALRDPTRGDRLRLEAAALKRRFEKAFWMPEERFYAEALDGDKRQVRSITSNPGHALYCGIVSPSRAEHVSKRLLAPDMFSGWGVRTMSSNAAAYNPMSYHDGSVWPHDNALIAAGLKRYGFTRATNRLATAMFEAAIHNDSMRLPELFCGFTRRAPNPPVDYPVACSPQAWAAGAPFLMLQAMLGLSARAHAGMLTVNEPHLPPWLNRVEFRNLRVGSGRISLLFRREGEITSFSVLSRDGDVRVVMQE